MPFLARTLQHVEGAGDAALTAAADGKLRRHDGDAEQDEEQNVDQHKKCAAIRAGDDVEAIDIAQADGAASGNQDEAQAG